MRIINWKHFPWFFLVCGATLAACLLYLGNFYPHLIRLPPAWIQTPTEHHTVGGTPLGLAFGTISLGIFIFAALLSLRKKIPLWRIGNVQRWLRAHIWLTFLTIPLVLMHCGFRLGGPMTTLLMVLYAIVMISGIYGLIIQHHLPRLMKERLPAETVFEQIPHIRSQLCVAAEKMRDSFRPAPPGKAGASPPVSSPAKAAAAPSAAMASTKGDLSTPTARPKSATGSGPVAAPITATAAAQPVATATKSETTPEVAPASVANPAATETKKAETISGPTPQETAVPKPTEEPAKVEAKNEAKSEVKTEPKNEPAPTPPAPKPAPASPAKPAAAAVAKPVVAAKAALPSDPESEAALAEFIDRQILPYLRARRGERYRLGDARFSDDTFRFVKLGVSEAYRGRVEEIQGWCDERRLLDLQTRLHHWLHGWLFIHVPFSFLLLMLTIWHACVTLFYY